MKLYDKVSDMIRSKRFDDLKSELNQYDSFTLVGLLKDLNKRGAKEEMAVSFRLLGKIKALTVFELLEDDMQRELFFSFTDDSALEIITNLSPDDRVHLLDELPSKVAAKMLNSLSKEDRMVTSELMGYRPETAGRIMTPKYISIKKNLTVEEAIIKIRSLKDEFETFYVIYVTDEYRKLLGVLSLRELIMAESEEKIADIMNKASVQVTTDDDQEMVAKVLQDTNLLAVPVVDSEKRLVGIVTVDDAMDIIEEETTEDIYKKAGFVAMQKKEEGKSNVLIKGSLFQVWKVRVPFLIITMLGGLMAGGVIDVFEETLEAVVALAIFIPVIMDMGGNVGTQSSTIFTRAFVLGQIDVKNYMKQLLKEMGVGSSMGIMLGAAAGMLAYLWQGIPALGMVVGVSLAVTIAVASFVGFLIPYILLRLGFDQAAGSDPFITTIKDITGLSIYFFLAQTFLVGIV